MMQNRKPTEQNNPHLAITKHLWDIAKLGSTLWMFTEKS